MEKYYLAVDLGAESGRVILGMLNDGRIELKEIHRFKTGPTSLPVKYLDHDHECCGNEFALVWDFLKFWEEIKTGIREAAQEFPIRSIGVDSWGVDFGLLSRDGELIAEPYHYRDNRTDGMMEKAFERLPKEKIYSLTGNQFMKLNTLYQLLSLKLNHSDFLEITDKFLMIPDLVNYWLTGVAVSEFSQATTTQVYNPRKRQWSPEIIDSMGLPPSIFPEVILSGTKIGSLRSGLVEELGCDCMVVSPATHDTASAVAAVPAENENFTWISSGTWSILGTNITEPIINEHSYRMNFTNEGAKAGSFYFCKNITGLWLVQQCRSQWEKEGKHYSYSELIELAEKAVHLKTIIDPNYEEFLEVGDMLTRIQNYCRLTDQQAPEGEGEIIRSSLQGLALRYRHTIAQLEEIAGKKSDIIHIVGGGTKNHLLSQFTADACDRVVVTGPVEATAVGNIITQAITMEDIKDWREGVQIIRNSFDIKEYHPGKTDGWDHAYQRFKQNIERTNQAF